VEPAAVAAVAVVVAVVVVLAAMHRRATLRDCAGPDRDRFWAPVQAARPSRGGGTWLARNPARGQPPQV